MEFPFPHKVVYSVDDGLLLQGYLIAGVHVLPSVDASKSLSLCVRLYKKREWSSRDCGSGT